MIGYQDPEAVRHATDACMGHGMRTLQLYRSGDEQGHAETLLELMAPPESACIVDVGCGVGDVAQRMLAARPDLGFLLLNLSDYQLSLCPQDMTRVQADMHDMPVNDACADVVMVNYTLGYADIDAFMREAWRVLKPAGILFIYDLSRRDLLSDAPCALMRDKFHYKVHSRHVINSQAVKNGFRFDSIRFPQASRDHLAPLLDEDYQAVMQELDKEVRPTAWRFIKDVA